MQLRIERSLLFYFLVLSLWKLSSIVDLTLKGFAAKMGPQQLVSCVRKIFYSERFCSLSAGAGLSGETGCGASGTLWPSGCVTPEYCPHSSFHLDHPLFPKRINVPHHYQENNTTAWHFAHFLVSFYCVTVQPGSMAEDHSQTETASPRLLTWGKTGEIFFKDLRGFSRIWSARYKQPVFCVMPKCFSAAKAKSGVCQFLRKHCLL